MKNYWKNVEPQKAIGTWLCDYAGHIWPFDEFKYCHTLNEVDNVVEG